MIQCLDLRHLGANQETPDAAVDVDKNIEHVKVHMCDGDNLEPGSLTGSPGSMQVSRVGMNYVDAAHRKAILDDIAEAKDYFHTNEEDCADSAEVDDGRNQRIVLFLRQCNPVNKAEILASLPSRPIVDRLVSEYFRSKDPTSVILHPQTFQNEYTKFWEDPAQVSTIWLSLLFSMMSLATCFCRRAGEALPEAFGEPEDMGNLYRFRAAQPWFVSSLTSHDLAALVICLELSRSARVPAVESVARPEDNFRTEQQERFVKALKTSYEIWIAGVEHSTEARRAAKTLEIMLDKIRRGGPEAEDGTSSESKRDDYERTSQNMVWRSDDPVTQTMPTVCPQTDGGKSDRGDTLLSPMSIFMQEADNIDDFGLVSPSALRAIEDMLDMPGNLDWEMWDIHTYSNF